MKERNPYPKIEEENGSTLNASESPCTPAYAEAYDIAEVESIPRLPDTWDDLLDCLKEGEEEFERGEFIPWDVATKNMRKHIEEYAS